MRLAMLQACFLPLLHVFLLRQWWLAPLYLLVLLGHLQRWLSPLKLLVLLRQLQLHPLQPISHLMLLRALLHPFL